MIEYIKGILFLVFFISFLDCIGLIFVKEKKSFSKRIIIGYVIYSAIIGGIGIVIQLLNLPWKIFMYSVVFVILLFLVLAIYKQTKQPRDFWTFDLFGRLIKSHFKNHWFIYLLTIIMLGFCLLNIRLQLLNNHLDDGWYLIKIAQLPYMQNPYETVPATGFEYSKFSNLALLSYAFNVFDLEASVYNYILDMHATVFARFVMNWLNYFIFANCFLWLIRSITAKYERISFQNAQYLTVFLPMLCFYPEWLHNHFFSLIDDWQINTAMWYGSSVVRCCGIFVYFIPLLEQSFLKRKRMIIYWVMATITLFTKSSIAMPLAIFAFFVYVWEWLRYNNKKYCKYILLLYGVVVIGLTLYVGIPSKTWSVDGGEPLTLSGIRGRILQIILLMKGNYKSIFIVGSLLVIVATLFIKNENCLIKKWSVLLLLSVFLIIVPCINYPFVLVSIYTHVVNRMFTLLCYTLMLTASLYVGVYLFIFLKKRIYQMLISVLGVVILMGGFAFCYSRDYNIRDSINILAENKFLIPQSTLELSEELKNISETRKEELYVLAPEFVSIYGGIHPISTSLRLETSEIKVVSAIPRYGSGDLGEMEKYSSEDHNTFLEFNSEPNVENIENMEDVLRKNEKINCIVLSRMDADTHLSDWGFEKVSIVQGTVNYTIYIRE